MKNLSICRIIQGKEEDLHQSQLLNTRDGMILPKVRPPRNMISEIGWLGGWMARCCTSITCFQEEKCEENQVAFFEGCLVFFFSEGAMILDTLSRLLDDSYVQNTNALATAL